MSLEQAARHYQSGNYGEALVAAGEVLERDSSNPAGYRILADSFFALGSLDNALKAYEILEKLGALDPGGVFSKARCLASLGRLEEAAGILNRLAPMTDTPQVHSERSRVLVQLGRLDEGKEAALELQCLAPGGVATAALASVSYYQGRYDEALELFERAVAQGGAGPQAEYSLGLILLMKGEFERGWDAYAAREKMVGAELHPKVHGLPKWKGKEAPDRRIIVHEEQGLGDTLQFVRYVPFLQELCAEVICRCQKPLLELLGRSFPQLRFVSLDDDGWEADERVSLFDLPALLDGDLKNIPDSKGYLEVPGQVPDELVDAVDSVGGFKVGLIWRGNTSNHYGRHRSCPTEHLASLFQVDGTTLFSLQYGGAEEELASHSFARKTVRLGTMLRNFSHQAWAMKQMDLVITVDTVTAHLAGGLGVPTWTMLSSPPDWRWFLEGEGTPWYDSMRLFRMAPGEDWKNLVGRVARSMVALSI